MEPKTYYQTLIELRNETLYKLVEAQAMVRSQEKQPDKTRVIKKVMDAETMQIKNVTVQEILNKNKEAVESLLSLKDAIDDMIKEEEDEDAKIHKNNTEIEKN